MADPWFKAAFGQHYPEVYSHRNEEEARVHLPQIETLARLKGLEEPILDCGCGTGRYTALLRERGYEVHGLDYSPDLLAKARENKMGTGGWLRGNMLHLPFRSSFARLLSLFTSFAYFDEDQKNLKVLNEMSNSLQQGGLLYLDFLNAQLVVESDWETKTLGNILSTSRKIVKSSSRQVIKEVKLMRDGEVFLEYEEKVKLYDLAWFQAAFDRNQLKMLKVFGDYSGSDFASSSPRLILLAEKQRS